MNSQSSQNGFALALVLWSIAGMALLVTAVIHFSRDDLDLVELRLLEAKSNALVRGVALLILRDSQMSGEEQTEQRGPRSYRYTIDGVLANGRELRASGVLPLASASAEELASLMQSVAAISTSEALMLAELFVAYREETPILHKSQLLAIPGFRKQIYDAIRPWVQALGPGEWQMENSPEELKAFLLASGVLVDSEESENPSEGVTGGLASDSGAGCTALTFDCLDSQKQGMGTAFRLFEVSLTFPDSEQVKRRVWVAEGISPPTVIEQSVVFAAQAGAP